MNHDKSNSPCEIEWAEYPEEVSEDFLKDILPAEFSKEEIQAGSACGEGGCG